jgi:undecaprenyl pyrophosphate synthase
MDGNLAWAARDGLSAKVAHVAATDAIHAAIEVAAREDVTTLTLYALSAGDWDPDFAARLAPLLRRHLLAEGSRMRVRLVCDYAREGSVEPVDLLIRTGCAGSFSNYLLWETSQAHVVSMRLPWPDFDAALFQRAVQNLSTE